jgi:GNAT superfamily N-acetyltransferase
VEALASGERVLVRPVRLSDEEPLQDLFYHLSDDSTYRRFLAFRRAHPHKEMQELVDLDYEQSVGLVVCRGENFDDIVAMARYDVDPAENLADIAFVVRDELQGKGIGTLLMRRMREIGHARGVAGFKADVLAENKHMLSVFQKSGLKLEIDLDGGVYQLKARFDGSAKRPASA